MKDLNSIKKNICKSCNKAMDFIRYSSIHNNSSVARQCIDSKNKIIEDLYK